jgi:hypothetical protein
MRVHLQKAHSFHNMSLALSTVVLLISCLSLPAPAQAPLPDAPTPRSTDSSTTTVASEHSLTFGERAHLYVHNFFSPESIIGPAFGAAVGQWENEPPGWHQGGEGYGRRFASGVARHEIGETIRFGFAAVDGEDPRYFLSEDRGAWARIRHAVASTFVSQTSSGHAIPAFSRFAGIYGAAFISNTWYPENRAGAGDAARRGSTALASSIGFNLVREFLPLFGGNAH